MTEQEKKDQEEQVYQAERKKKQEYRREWEADQQAEAEALRQQNKPKSPYKEFTQMNNVQIKSLRQLLEVNPTAVQIFLFIMEFMNRENAMLLSHKMLEEALGVHRITIVRAVKVLTEYKFLKIYRSGNTTVYFLNSDIVWKSDSKGHRYADFNARVMIAESEQVKKQPKVYTKRLNTVKIVKDTAPKKQAKRSKPN